MLKQLVYKDYVFFVSDKKGIIYRQVDDGKSVRLFLCPQVISNSGYKEIRFYDYVKQKYILVPVHKLVALAHVPNPDSNLYTQVDHLDTDRMNNDALNLRWSTYEMNNVNPLTQKHRIVSNSLRQIDK